VKSRPSHEPEAEAGDDCTGLMSTWSLGNDDHSNVKKSYLPGLEGASSFSVLSAVSEDFFFFDELVLKPKSSSKSSASSSLRWLKFDTDGDGVKGE
jgi:hypothetical protein